MPTYYDPSEAPSPVEWLALDEQQRISQAENFHKKHGIRLPNTKVHAVFHVTVENQIAEQHGAVVRAMARLKSQGLNRHDCIHAIGWVLANHIHELSTAGNDDPPETTNARYSAAVERLQAKDWLSLASD